jgi:hypothetical protein
MGEACESKMRLARAAVKLSVSANAREQRRKYEGQSSQGGRADDRIVRCSYREVVAARSQFVDLERFARQIGDPVVDNSIPRKHLHLFPAIGCVTPQVFPSSQHAQLERQIRILAMFRDRVLPSEEYLLARKEVKREQLKCEGGGFQVSSESRREETRPASDPTSGRDRGR